MKLLQLSFVVGLLASGIIAELRIERNEDGSVKSVYQTGTALKVKKKRDACPVKGTTTTLATTLSTSSASTFTDSLSVISDTFSSYTEMSSTTSPTPTSDLTDASLTSTTSSPTSTATCAPPGGLCTIDNFVTACCTNPDGSVGCYFPTQDSQNGQCFL